MENLDTKLKRWLVKFLARQRSYVDVDTRILGIEANTELAMRQKIGRRMAEVSGPGLSLGLTTENNPQLLRCYGKHVYLANIDVRSKQ